MRLWKFLGDILDFLRSSGTAAEFKNAERPASARLIPSRFVPPELAMAISDGRRVV
jgi:hypothetical protein